MVRKIFCGSSLLAVTVIGGLYLIWPPVIWSLVVVGPLILLGIHDMLQPEHTLLRIYPVIGHGRYLMEELRPEIQQYFVESNIDGMPLNRELRSTVYARAKGQLDKLPFGTQRDVYAEGYEWIEHSICPAPVIDHEQRVWVGQDRCAKPYHSSCFNISAMSYGSLGQTAIEALNTGAKLGGFAHNTGEGGISPYHDKPGGDLIWQIGTGYFGCRSSDGGFDADLFAERARAENVKMIEVKLSQGAKPGHGGILPGRKVTPEIARIRGVPVGKTVHSPAAHQTFSTPRGLLDFVVRLRELSGGKPVGFKLCVGYRREFLGICKALLETDQLPDFITVDGAEGGTGAAPMEFTNVVGMPLREGLVFVHSALRGIGLRDRICLAASAKAVTGFHLFQLMALGADICNSARAMMLALGCIQARRCHDNKCPTGVATQEPARVAALDVPSKANRVQRYHAETVESLLQLVGAGGLRSPVEICPQHVKRRVDSITVRTFAEIYDFLEPGELLGQAVPERFAADWQAASSDAF